MMENRSFDHFLGWLPGADGKQAGLSYTDTNGAVHPTFALAPDFQGCSYHDPDHSYEGARVEWNNGACDGWLRANDLWSIGYYRQQDLAFLGKVAPAFTTCDRFFASFLGPTFPNRMYSLSGVTDRTSNTFNRMELPTIFDRLAAKRVSAGYYYGNFSFLLLYQKHKEISHQHATFFKQCKTGKLPSFSYIDPNGTFRDEGPSSGNEGNDDHPHADIRAGEYFMSQIYNAVTQSPAWPRTLLLVTYDEGAAPTTMCRPPPRPTSSRSTSSAGSASRACSCRRTRGAGASRTARTTTRRSSSSSSGAGASRRCPFATRRRRTSPRHSTSRGATSRRRRSPCPSCSSGLPAPASRLGNCRARGRA
jgi:Phospholipase C